jgi:hypothetical protein
MKHQPFEKWILSAQPLTPTEGDELDRHLTLCQACRALHAGVLRAEAVFRGASLAEPGEGFAARWKLRLAQEREGRRRRLAWWTFAWTTLAAAPVALAVAWQTLAFSGFFPSLLAQALLQAIRWWTWLRLIGEIARALVTNLPVPAVSGAVLGWVTLLTAAGSLAVAWSALMIRYSPQGGRR